MSFLLFVVVLCLSAWVYSDAKSRDSSHPVLWALGCLLMFIIFFPLYLIARPSRKAIERSAVLCPCCGKYCEPPVKFCPNCGNKL